MHDEDNINDSIQLGTLYFKNGEYEKCIRLYHKVAREMKNMSNSDVQFVRRRVYSLPEVPPVGPLVHPKLGTVLDQCAAAYEKLGNLQAALHEGEQLIEYDPASCRAYLRVSKILILMNRDSEAMKLILKGLYYINRAQKRYSIAPHAKHLALLKERFAKLRTDARSREISPLQREQKSLRSEPSTSLPQKRSRGGETVSNASSSSCTDPLQYLADDVLECVFRHLPLCTILACHQVSKAWYKFLTLTPDLYCRRVSMREKITSQEFASGISFLNKVMGKHKNRQIGLFRLRSVANSINFSKVMDHLFLSMARSSMPFSIRELDIMNQDLTFYMLMNQVCKFGSSDADLVATESLRVGFRSRVPDANLLLAAFPGLKSLEIVALLDSTENDSTGLFSSHFLTRTVTSHKRLRHLTLINHSKSRLQVTGLPIRINELTQLESLRIASYNFTDALELRQFLQNSAHLQLLYLENNTALDIVSVLLFLEVGNSPFRLRSLAVREATARTRSWDVNPADIPQLHGLVNLDLYSTSLTTRSFLRLLQIANHDGNLRSLAIRNSTNILFANDTFTRTNTPRLTLGNIFEMCPDIEHLSLCEVGVDNTTIRNFARELADQSKCLALKTLDLSFCERLDGTGILSLLEAARKPLGSGFRIAAKLHMTLHGLPLHNETLRLLASHPTLRSIAYDPTKLKWKQFGVNTLVLE